MICKGEALPRDSGRVRGGGAQPPPRAAAARSVLEGASSHARRSVWGGGCPPRCRVGMICRVEKYSQMMLLSINGMMVISHRTDGVVLFFDIGWWGRGCKFIGGSKKLYNCEQSDSALSVLQISIW